MLSKGVSKELAEHRKANISKVLYDLSFDIPANPREKVKGKAIISFNLKTPQDVVLDFTGGFDGTCYVWNQKKKRRAAEVVYRDEHIIIPMASMLEGDNKIELHFTANDKALNRNEDYMYTLFVPDLARSAFPCFDQPDLDKRQRLPASHLSLFLRRWQVPGEDFRPRGPSYSYSLP